MPESKIRGDVLEFEGVWHEARIRGWRARGEVGGEAVAL
jgi:hypothetical protein